VSETTPERAPGPPAAGSGNFLTRKVGPLPTWAWLAIIGVGGAAVWLIWQRRQSAAADNANTSSAGTGGDCQDASGNTVPCDQSDEAGQIATLQTEIQDLEQKLSQSQTTPPPPDSTAPNPPGPISVPPDIRPPSRGPKFFREIATGGQSLNAVAKARHTTVAHLEEVTRQSAGQPGGISAKNLEAFNKYVAKGTSHRMPRGLIYFTSRAGGTSQPAGQGAAAPMTTAAVPNTG
jgi:hypothetical protein